MLRCRVAIHFSIRPDCQMSSQFFARARGGALLFARAPGGALRRVVLLLAAVTLFAAATNKLLTTHAQAAAPNQLQRWEYMCKSELAASPRGMATDVQRAANQAGQEGWELVSGVGTNVFCFKRALR